MNIEYEIIDFHTHPFINRENNICAHTDYCNMSAENTKTLLTGLGISKICGAVIGKVIRPGDSAGRIYYDAWGNFTASGSKSTDADFLQAVLFRYRGYIYDTDTGLYYLQTRYYDSMTGRFISPDSLDNLGANGDLQSYNLYAYCSNNPVMGYDPTGEWIHLAVGAVVGGIIGGVSAALSGGDWVDVVIGSATGVASGLLAASGAGVIAQVAGSAALSMTSNAIGQIRDIAADETGETTFNWGDMLVDGAVSAVTALWGKNGASYGNVAGIKSATNQMFKRIGKGDGIKTAFSYYAKTAHAQGGKFVLKGLAESLGKSAVGAGAITLKNHLWAVLNHD